MTQTNQKKHPNCNQSTACRKSSRTLFSSTLCSSKVFCAYWGRKFGRNPWLSNGGSEKIHWGLFRYYLSPNWPLWKISCSYDELDLVWKPTKFAWCFFFRATTAPYCTWRKVFSSSCWTANCFSASRNGYDQTQRVNHLFLGKAYPNNLSYSCRLGLWTHGSWQWDTT